MGALYKANVAMPDITEYYSPVEAMKREIEVSDRLTEFEKSLIVPCGYGHMADGDI